MSDNTTPPAEAFDPEKWAENMVRLAYLVKMGVLVYESGGFIANFVDGSDNKRFMIASDLVFVPAGEVQA